MKNILSIILVFSGIVKISANDTLQYQLWLESDIADRVKVVQQVNAESGEEFFYFANTIPGTYEIQHYEKFIEKLRFLDENGNPVSYKETKSGKYKIRYPEKVKTIEYYVNDSWDEINAIKHYVVFCSRTNFEKDKVFVLNTSALFGYFKSDLNKPLKIGIHKQQPVFYPSTSLEKKVISDTFDVLTADSYHELFDSPVMYCSPDTISFTYNGKKIITSCFSYSSYTTAEYIQEHLVKPAVKTVAKHYPGFIPDEYWFIYYLYNEEDPELDNYLSMAGDALEHNHSSFYVMPAGYLNSFDTASFDYEQLWIAMHEFLHKIFPLTIHSNLVENMNYYYDKMSKHLWLYEGVTEYLSMKNRLREGLISEETFLDEMRNNIASTENHKSAPMAVVSANVLKKKYAKQYDLVYTKGALLAFMLDIELFTGSDGNYSIDALINDLIKEPWHNSFSEDEIYTYIKEKSGVDVLPFFNHYIESDDPVPYADYFNKIGIRYGENCLVPEYTFGEIKNVVLHLNTDSKDDSFVEFEFKESKLFGKGILKVLKIDNEIPNEWNIEKIIVPKNNTPVDLQFARDGITYTKSMEPITAKTTRSYKLETDKDAEAYQKFIEMMKDNPDKLSEIQ
jgi:predicted metalloprotease with PDZ domain